MPLQTDTVTLSTVVLVPQITHTALVSVYRFADSPQIKLKVGAFESEAHATTGWAEISLEFISTSVNDIKLVPIGDGVDQIFVDGLLVVDGEYNHDYFDGNTPAAEGYVYSWTGVPNESTSLRALEEETTTEIVISGMSARYYKVNPSVSGPWRGGLGHSGTKFVGKPSYIANGGMDDGQISVSATLKETGDGQ